MGADDLREQLRRDPFQPFRLHLSNGLFFDIRNPNMAFVTRHSVTIGHGIEEDKQRFAVVGLIHVVWLELLLPTP